jgi:hypothetical protein
MNEVLHANIFFIIASVATVIFCVLISLALYHVVKILILVRSILERVEATSELLAKDVASIRASVAQGGWFSRFMTLILGATGTKRRTRSHD